MPFAGRHVDSIAKLEIVAFNKKGVLKAYKLSAPGPSLVRAERKHASIVLVETTFEPR